jgi:hypothetical protein
MSTRHAHASLCSPSVGHQGRQRFCRQNNHLHKPSMSRPWYRTHPLTWVILLVAGSQLVYGQFFHVSDYFKSPAPSYRVGWPDSYAVKWSPSGPLDQLDWHCLAADVGWWFVLITPPLILSERLARRQFHLSLKAALSVLAAGAVLLCWTDWSYYWWVVTDRPIQGTLSFDLALLFVRFCWFWIVALAAANSITTIWKRSSNALTRVASYVSIGLAVVGVCFWLYSNGFGPGNVGIQWWLPSVLLVGTGVLLSFGLLVWLSSTLAALLRSSVCAKPTHERTS